MHDHHRGCEKAGALGTSRWAVNGAALLVLLTAVAVLAGLMRMPHPSTPTISLPRDVQATLAQAVHQPLRFEPAGNPQGGGHDEGTFYLARGAGYQVHLGPAGAVLHLDSTTLSIRPVGGGATRAEPLQQLTTRHHYLLGQDTRRWRTRVPTYGRVRYPQVYPGIDLVYYGQEGRLEYDFVLAPGADPGLIRLAFPGARDITLTERGELLLHTATRTLVQPPPHVYQDIDGRRQTVDSSYRIDEQGRVGFRLAAYDPGHTLVIDPVVVYASYLGGNSDDRVSAMAVDSAGNIYLTGDTTSADLASNSAYDTACGSDGDCDEETLSDGPAFRKDDIFVTKLAPDGSVIFTTYLGGGRIDRATDIAVDATGDIYITGYSRSADYPTTAGSIDPACTDVAPADGICDEGLEAVVTRLRGDGTTLVYSTFLGGAGDDLAHALAVDGAGNAYVTGSTASGDFPATAGAFKTTFSGHEDVFVAKLNGDGSTLFYATYVGGATSDIARDIAIDAGGNAYVTGYTSSQDFPTTAGALDTQCGLTGQCDGPEVDDPLHGQPTSHGTPARKDTTYDAFVFKLDPGGANLVYATYLGGERYDYGNAIAVDSAGRAYVAGETRSANFPGAPFTSAYQDTIDGGYDGFVARLNATGDSLDFFTYLGGGSGDVINDLAVNASGEIYVTGSTLSRDFPTRAPFYPSPPQRLDDAVIVYDSEAFLAKFNADASDLVFASLYGGQYNDYANTLALGDAGQVYFAGYSFSVDLPLSDDAAQALHRNEKDGTDTVVASDAFLARVADGSSDLVVTLSDASDPIDQGEEIAYTAVVANQGASTAQGVRLSYDIPQDTNLVSASPSQGNCSRNYNTVHCELGRLAPTASATIALVIRPRGAGEFQSTTTVTALASDANPADNSATETTTVTPPFFTPATGGSGAFAVWLLAILLLWPRHFAAGKPPAR